MSRECVLVIDAGTTGCRAIVFNSNGDALASAYKEFPSSHPQPDWVEQNAEDWWKAVCYSTKEVMKEIEGKEDIMAVTVTNQRETVVAVNAKGDPLRPAIVWQDRRTVKECDWITENIGAEKIYKTTGLTVDPYFTAPKLLWLKNNETEIFGSAFKFFLVHDYVIYKLTGRDVTEYSNASRTMLFNLKNRSWSEELLDSLGFPSDKLPEVIRPGAFVGELTTGASSGTGISDGVHVYSGGGDQQCAALGTGVVAPGRLKATTGTGTFCLAYTDEAKFDTERRVLCSAHVVPNAYVVEASIFTTGSAYRWLRDNFAAELLLGDRKPYEVLNEEAEESEPGARGITFIPHLAGSGAPHWNPKAVGIIHGLSLGHNRGDIVRAMMEGTAVEIKRNIEVMRSIGLELSELRVTGGGARSKLWCQVTADMCRLPVLRAATEDATALGAAILAATGAKIHESLEIAVNEMVKAPEELLPTEESKDIYQKVYEISIELYNKLGEKNLP